MITKEDYIKFRSKKPDEPLSEFESDHLDELMKYEVGPSEKDIDRFTEMFKQVVENTTSEDINRLLS